MSQNEIENTHADPEAEEKSDEQTQSHTVPDGGFRAWLQVAGTFCIYLNTWSVSLRPNLRPSELLSDHRLPRILGESRICTESFRHTTNLIRFEMSRHPALHGLGQYRAPFCSSSASLPVQYTTKATCAASCILGASSQFSA